VQVGRKGEEEYHTFVSNCGGNLSVLRSFSSLSEKRRSWSADVPLKNPERKEMKKRTRKGRGNLPASAMDAKSQRQRQRAEKTETRCAAYHADLTCLGFLTTKCTLFQPRPPTSLPSLHVLFFSST